MDGDRPVCSVRRLLFVVVGALRCMLHTCNLIAARENRNRLQFIGLHCGNRWSFSCCANVLIGAEMQPSIPHKLINDKRANHAVQRDLSAIVR